MIIGGRYWCSAGTVMLECQTKNGWLEGNDAVGWKVQEGFDKWMSLEGMNEINR